MEILVIGVGQYYSGDDSVGLDVVKVWSACHPEHAATVKVILCNTPGMELLESSSEECKVIVLVDAIKDPHNPGKITIMGMNDLDDSFTDLKTSHGLGVAQSIKLKEIIYQDTPPMVTVIGISGTVFNLGSQMTNEVNKAIPLAVETLDQIIHAFQNKNAVV